MTFSISRLTAPLFLRRAGHGRYLRFLAEAEANQWKTPGEIRRIQQKKLTTLVDGKFRFILSDLRRETIG